MNKDKETVYIAALKKGDTAALREVITAYSGYVCAVARNFSRGTLTEEDIDEISSDVFYKLWNSRKRLNADYGLRAYLSAIVRNTVKDRFKSRARDMGETYEDVIDEYASDFSVEDKAELNDTIKCLYAEMEKLPADEREIFFRTFFYGEKCPEIAEKKGMAENTVYTKLRRTRQKLKKIMTEKGYYNA